MTVRPAPISIVCVWNDDAVRRTCLDRSIESLRSTIQDLDYVPVDNRGQPHLTAGSALNQGVRQARHEYIAFVQQDIYLHSLAALEHAAGALAADARLGMIGATGMTARGDLVGRVRDRVVLLGERAQAPVTVDSVDEILFVARREQLLREPLTQLPELAWHAYAVEYGLRLRAGGQTVAVLDLPLTHNSLSTNVVNLDGAHARVARLHPDLLPVTTTCGTIVRRPRTGATSMMASQRWRARWLRQSWRMHQTQQMSQDASLVLGDPRWDVDLIGSQLDGDLLHIHSVTSDAEPFPDPPEGTILRRRGYDVSFTSGPLEACLTGLGGKNTLLTNLHEHHLASLETQHRDGPYVVGYDEAVGFWAVSGPVASLADQVWTAPRARPAAWLVR